ncbi:MAG: ABC transporter permease subunit [Clostridiales bacterium]|nr:ABC transporter permease subunit [Clostridiales bacterium]
MYGLGKIFRHEMLKIAKEKTLLFGFLVLPVITLFLTVGMTMLTPMDQEEAEEYRMYFHGISIESYNIGTMEDKEIWIVPVAEDPQVFMKSDDFHHYDVMVDFSDIRDVKIYYYESNSVSCYLKMSAESFVRKTYEELYKGMNRNVAFREVFVEDIKKEDDSNRMIAMLLPYMLVLPLTANIANLAGDTVAGDKARGTFYQVMLSPIPPLSLIMAKILSVSVISIVSSAIYIGMDVAGSRICKAVGVRDAFGFADVSITVPQLLLILLYAVLLCYLFSNIGVLISLFCKDTSQAQTAQIPMTLLCTIASIMSMFRFGISPASHYMIPVYNICLIFQDLLNSRAKMSNMLLVAVSLLIPAVLVLLATLLSYKSERVRT